MYTFKDATGAARAAMGAVWTYAILDLLESITAFVAAGTAVADAAALFDTLAFFVSAILVGRWIYRTNANAHSFGSSMAITPGWAVGWFFVPFANLIKPYEGVKETWIESHLAAGRTADTETPLLAWWWGLWIVTNIAASVSLQVEMRSPAPITGFLLFDILIAIGKFGLCMVLIQLMKRLSQTQLLASQGSVFA